MSKGPPANFEGVNLQMPARDAVEQRIQDMAWAAWYAQNPVEPGSAWLKHHRHGVLRRLRETP